MIHEDAPSPKREAMSGFGRLAASAAFFLTLVASGAAAQSGHPTRTTLSGPSSVPYGQRYSLGANVFYGGPACAVGQALSGQLVLRRDGLTVRMTNAFEPSSEGDCADGDNVARATFLFHGDEVFDRHEYTVEYWGGLGLGGSSSGVLAVDIVPLAQAASPGGAGVIEAGATYTGSFCASRNLSFETSGSFSPPAGAALPYGAMSYDFSSCYAPCRQLCPPGVHPYQDIALQVPVPIPPDSLLWWYPLDGGYAGPWLQLPAAFEGRIARFQVHGISGPSAMHGLVALAPSGHVPGTVAPMWWGGAQENGWGLSMAQSGERLSAVLYLYREDGTPTWFVMPLGGWNTDTGAPSYSGMLYRPSGSWFGNYDASAVDLGSAVGQARITFSSDSSATLEYDIREASRRKTIIPLQFGAAIPATGEHEGHWSDGTARPGWGLSIGEQGNTLFCVWYTYAQDGSPVWFVMPGGSWTSANVYTGTLYRTHGSSSTASYDPADFRATSVGAMTLEFTGPETARMTYSANGVSGSVSMRRQPY